MAIEFDFDAEAEIDRLAAKDAEKGDETPPSPDVSARFLTPKLEVGSESEVAEELIRIWAASDGVEAIADNAGCVWRYHAESGTWREHSEKAIKRDLRKFDGLSYGEGRVYRVSKGKTAGVLDALRAYQESGELDEAPCALVCRNTAFVVDDSSWTLDEVALGPELYQRFAHDVDYRADAKAPKFIASLRRLFVDDDIRMIQEFCGAAVFGLGRKLKKALLIQGSTGIGKSQLLDVLAAMLPGGAVSTVLPHDFSHRFRAIPLDGALLNIANELPRRELRDWHSLKTVVSCETMPFERKNGAVYRAEPRAAHLFSCNHFPAVAAATQDFWERWAVVVARADAGIVRGTGAEIVDYGKHLASTERAGIVAWLVEGARMFCEHKGRLPLSSSSRVALDRWRGVADTVSMWFSDECEEAPVSTPVRGLPSLTTAFTRYKQWARKHEEECTPMSRFKEWFEDRHLVSSVKQGASVHLLIEFKG